MFDLGWTELMIVAVVAIVVVGPRELPQALRAFGGLVRRLRRMSHEMRRHFDDAVQGADLQTVTRNLRKDLAAPLQAIDPREALREPLDLDPPLASSSSKRTPHSDTTHLPPQGSTPPGGAPKGQSAGPTAAPAR